MNILNPDFDLNTFYWMYAKSDQVQGETVVTITVACFDTSVTRETDDASTPFMIIECKPLQKTTTWFQPEQDEYTVDPRVINALVRHFNHTYMVNDGLTMMAEYLNGASGELHKHPEFGQAIFGMDLEEAHA